MTDLPQPPSSLSGHAVRGVTDSNLSMWRAIFALAHADQKVSDEEARFLAEALDGVNLSPDQKSLLYSELQAPQNTEEMFDKITVPEDRTRFFELARELIRIDGDDDGDIQAMLVTLNQKNMSQVNFDSLIGNVDLSFDDDDK
jgi:uncharacterized membrane protein YebE (DUF533 family)